MSIGGLMMVKIYVNFANQRRIKMIFKITDDYDTAEYEEIPQEELWEDGELNNVQVQQKIINHTMQKGDWYLVRRIEE